VHAENSDNTNFIIHVRVLKPINDKQKQALGQAEAQYEGEVSVQVAQCEYCMNLDPKWQQNFNLNNELLN